MMRSRRIPVSALKQGEPQSAQDRNTANGHSDVRLRLGG